MATTASLEKAALFSLFLLVRLRTEYSANGLVEDCLEAFLRQGRTFQILDGTDFLNHRQALQKYEETCHLFAMN